MSRQLLRQFSDGLAQRSERLPQLGAEQLRLLPRGEVAASVDFVEVDEVAIGAPGPCLRGSIALARKDRDGYRERNLGGLLCRSDDDAASAVSPSTAAPPRSQCSSASTALCRPALVIRRLFGIAAVVCPVREARMPSIHAARPTGESVNAVADRLRPRAHHRGVGSAALLGGCIERVERRAFLLG